MKKRLVALVMAIAMVISVSSYPVTAIAETGTEVKLAITTDKTGTITVGDEINVNINVLENPGINNLSAVILFDAEQYEFVKFSKNREYAGADEPGENFTVNTEQVENGKVVFLSTAPSEFNDCGIYYNFKLKVKETAKAGAASINFKFGTASNDVTQYAKNNTIYYLDSTSVTVPSIDISIPVIGITISGADSITGIGNTAQLTVSAQPENAAQPKSDMSDVTWSSNKESVATVANGLVTAVGAGSATITAEFDGKTATKEITVTKSKMTGNVTITGSAVFGKELTARYTGNAENVSFSWYRGETKIATGDTYTLTKEDIGNKLHVVATSADYDGSVLSAETDAVEKADQSAPDAPVIEANENIITVTNVDTNAEYKLIGAGGDLEFGKTTTFTVQYGMTYFVTARYPETATHKESAEADSNPVTIAKAPCGLNVTAGEGGSVSGTPEDTVREGDEVTLTATASDFDHKFVKWEVTGITLTEEEAKATKITFTMGSEDVTIKAVFAEKDAVPYGFETAEFTYDEKSHAPTYSPEEIANMTVSVKYLDSLNSELSDVPVDAGTYKIVVTFTPENANSDYRTTIAEQEFKINKARWKKPSEPTVSNITDSSFVLSTVKGQEYAIRQRTQTPAEDEWKDGAEVITTGLDPATSYYVFTRVKGDKNHEPSEAVYETVITLHRYAWELSSSEQTATVRVGGTLPEAMTVTLTNKSTTKIQSVMVTLGGTNAGNFTLDAVSDTLAKDGEQKITVRPNGIDNTKEGTYTCTVTVKQGRFKDPLIATFTINVVNKEVAEISGIADKTVTFNGANQTIDLSQAAVVCGDKKLDAEKLTVTYRKDDAVAANTRDAGTYNVSITYEDADYVGSTNATLTITPKDVTVTGFAAASKEYDGNANASVTGSASLNGKIDGTDVSIATGDLGWRFEDKNVGINKKVTNFNAISLTGADAANYNLTNPTVELKGTITPLSITVNVTIDEKTYNGRTDNARVKMSATGIIAGDNVQFTNVTGTYTTADAGDNAEVTVTYTISGADQGNYNFQIADKAYGKVNKANLEVNIYAPAAVTYDGNAHGIGSGNALDNRIVADKGKTLYVITYNGSDALPVDAGTYSVTAKLTDEGSKNYNLVVHTVDFVINKADMTATDKEYSVAFMLSGKQVRPMSDMQLAPANVSGKWSVAAGTNEILDSAAIEGENLVFTVKSGLTTADIGKKAELTLTFTPDKNYNPVKATVTVTLAQDTYTNSIVGTLPTQVKLGDALELSGVKLVTKFGSGAAEQQLDVTDAAKVEVTTNYDSAATGADALGTKTVTFTDKANSGITYTHSFTVVDVLDGTALTAGETEFNYKLKEVSSIGFDGKVLAKYKSGATKTLTHANVTLTFAEQGMTEARALNTLGAHKATLTYTETYFDGTTAAQSIGIVINVSASDAAMDGKPGSEGFALEPIPDEGKEMSYNNGSADVPASLVRGKLRGGQDAAKAALQEEEKKSGAFNNVGDNKVYENISFTDADGKSVSFKDGKMQATIPYPSDSSKDNDFVMIIRKADGSMETIVPVKTDGGLQFTIEGDVDFVLGWYTPAPAPVQPSEPEQDPQDSFWNEVYWALIRSGKGSVITANAGYFDKVPQGVLRAVDASGNTLVINSAFGVQLVITPGTLEKLGAYRFYYPISYLKEMLKGSIVSGSGSSTGVTIGVLMPTTGDATVVDHPYSMTPATAGIIPGLESVANARPVIENADGVSVLDGAQRNEGAVIGGGMLIGLGLLALLGAAYVTMRKRGN